MEREPREELFEFLSRFPVSVVDVHLALRQKVWEVAPDSTEIITNVPYTVSCAYTFTHSIKEAFVYVAAYSKHANLGFVDGVSLSDPERRLKGDGKSMRHLNFRSVAEADDAYALQLLRQAARNSLRPTKALQPKTHITKAKQSAPGH